MKPGTALPRPVRSRSHTPYYQEEHYIYSENTGALIAVARHEAHDDDDERFANAAYITHAANMYPRLVEALRLCVGKLDAITIREGDGPPPLPWAEVDRARALLAECEE